LLPAVRKLDKLLADYERLRQKLKEYEALVQARRAQVADRLPRVAGSIKAHFAASLRHRRQAAGLTQADAAAIAGLTQPQWSAYELGVVSNPGLDHLIAMAAALGIKVGELLDAGSADTGRTRRRPGKG